MNPMTTDSTPLSRSSAAASGDLVLGERDEDLSGRPDPLRDDLPVAPPDEGAVLPRDFLMDRVVLRTLMARDVEDVAVAERRDQPHARAVVLQERVGRDRRPVEERVDGSRIAVRAAHPRDQSLGGIGNRRGHLADPDLPGLGIGDDHVRERPADVDAGELHRPLPRCSAPAVDPLKTRRLILSSLWLVGLGVDPVEQRARVGKWALLRPAHGVMEKPTHPRRQLGVFIVREADLIAQPDAVALDRIALRPLCPQLAGDVGGVVVRSVALHPERDALEQRRAIPLARLLDRPRRLAVDGEDVGAVHDHPLEAVGRGAVGDVLGGELEAGGGRVGPLVVVADEHDREAAHTGEVQRLVDCADDRGAFAEPRHRNALLAANPEGEGLADRDRHHRTHVADHRHHAEAGIGEMHIGVAATRGTVDAAHVLRQDPPRLEPADDVHRHVPLRRRGDVLWTKSQPGADRGALVPAARVEAAGDLALLVEEQAPLLDAAVQKHVAERVDQLGPREPDVRERAGRVG